MSARSAHTKHCPFQLRRMGRGRLFFNAGLRRREIGIPPPQFVRLDEFLIQRLSRTAGSARLVLKQDRRAPAKAEPVVEETADADQADADDTAPRVCPVHLLARPHHVECHQAAPDHRDEIDRKTPSAEGEVPPAWAISGPAALQPPYKHWQGHHQVCGVDEDNRDARYDCEDLRLANVDDEDEYGDSADHDGGKDRRLRLRIYLES